MRKEPDPPDMKEVSQDARPVRPVSRYLLR
jgi:hypothetical protein